MKIRNWKRWKRGLSVLMTVGMLMGTIQPGLVLASQDAAHDTVVEQTVDDVSAETDGQADIVEEKDAAALNGAENSDLEEIAGSETALPENSEPTLPEEKVTEGADSENVMEPEESAPAEEADDQSEAETGTQPEEETDSTVENETDGMTETEDTTETESDSQSGNPMDDQNTGETGVEGETVGKGEDSEADGEGSGETNQEDTEPVEPGLNDTEPEEQEEETEKETEAPSTATDSDADKKPQGDTGSSQSGAGSTETTQEEELLEEELPKLLVAKAAPEKYKVPIEVDGVTFYFDLIPGEEGENGTASLRDIEDPETEMDVTLPSEVTYEEDGSSYDYTVTGMSVSSSWGSEDNRSHITSITFPDTMTEMTGSFNCFTELTEVTIPGSVKTFAGSFQNMQKLEKIIFEDGVEDLAANSMINNCPVLTEIELPDSLQLISMPSVFSGAPALESIILPEGIQFLEGGAFQNSGLKEIVLPASVTEISSNMFEGCSELMKVDAKATITKINSYAFSGCTSLQEIPDLSIVTELGDGAFYGCGECQALSGTLNLSSLNEIPDMAFSYTFGIEEIIFSENLKSIGIWAFIQTSITQLEFPETLESIGAFAFCFSDYLTGELVIPDSVTTLEAGAFKDTAIKSVTIGSGVKEILTDTFPKTVEKVIIKNSQDDIIIDSGALPENIEIEFTEKSVEDEVGDTISYADDAPTLQEAVNAAAENGQPVIIAKDIKLAQTVTISSGEIIITTDSDELFAIASVKEGHQLDQLFNVEEGASVTFSGKLKLSGHYSSGSIIYSEGNVTLEDGATVSGAVISKDDTGVVAVSGQNASLTINDGGTIEENDLKYVGSSGVVRASNGAKIVMNGGAIKNNKAVLDDEGDINSTSSGILLYNESSLVMEGGSISGNAGYRGSAVLMYGEGKETFVLKGGTISGNKTSKAGRTDSSGAVHVQNNAAFLMEGGSIKNNQGGKGAGVAVLDGPLQAHESGEEASFIMTGGSISGNSGVTGGGIYAFSNGVRLISGEITNNRASNLGGGIYSEGDDKKSGTVYLENVLITDNIAREGGGMWFCRTGSAVVHVTNGAAVYGNSAEADGSEAAAGDDFAFAHASNADKGKFLATLSDRMLGGGAVKWYADGGIYLMNSVNLYPSIDRKVPRYDEAGKKPAVNAETPITDSDKSLALKAVTDAAAQKLANRQAKLIISGNTAARGGGIGANGGIEIGTEEEWALKVTKNWDDVPEDKRVEVKVRLKIGETLLDDIKLNADNQWTASFKGLPDPETLEGKISVAEVSSEYDASYSEVVMDKSKNLLTVTVTNRLKPEEPKGKLIIKKTVSGNAANRNYDFTFHITADVNGDPIEGKYGDVTFTGGEGGFTLRADQQVSVTELPDGTNYSVQETDGRRMGYTVSVDGVSGDSTKGTVPGGETVRVEFHNRKTSSGGGGGGGGGGHTPGTPVTPELPMSEIPETSKSPHPEINRLPVMGVPGPLEAIADAEESGAQPLAAGLSIIDALKEKHTQNADLGGWLTVPGTGSGYPVMFTPQNWEYYLHHDFGKKKSSVGIPFMGEATEIGGDNTLIHGHNMNGELQFGWIWNYMYPNFRTTHPTIDFKTIYDAEGQYEVMAVFIAPVYAAEQENVFKWYQYVGKLNKAQFDYYVANAKASSVYDTGVTAEYGDKLLTLETCASTKTNDRLVVVARKKAPAAAAGTDAAAAGTQAGA
ncbi:MAG: leucine-rich repeat protein [Eubacteriales bacterium]|nr:leucine-rich repeat protein [Eubacteriales bacterium]